MNVNFNGYGENVATFAADAGLTEPGVPVKMSGDGTVAKCAANEPFCGICVGVRSGYAAVQLNGYVRVPAGEKISVGYQKLAAGDNGIVAVNNAGRELLVVDADAESVGFIL